MKACFKCGAEKPLSDFYKHPSMSDGHVNKCKECNKKDVRENRADKKDYYDEYDRNRSNHRERVTKQAERVKERYHKDEEFRQKVLTQRKRWEDSNTHKKKAHSAVGNALRDGKLIKAENCEGCDCNDKPLQGHHWSYEEKYWLDVVWLCPECHGQEHKRLNEICRNPDGYLTEEDFKFK